MKSKIKLSENFRSDFKIWCYILCGLLFIVCVWYSLTHLLIETLHFPVPDLKNKDTEEVTNVFGTLYLILFGIIVLIILAIKKLISNIINYIFIIEKDK